MTSQPARLLKGDEEIGYWEYEADVTDGRWVVELSRGEAWNPGLLDDVPPAPDEFDYQRYHLGVTMHLNGELVFTTNDYEPGFAPFLSAYEMNGMMAMAMVANLAMWYRGSLARRELGEVMEAIERFVDVTLADQNGEPINTGYYQFMPSDDIDRLEGQARSTSDLCTAFYLLGMEETTPEWRRDYCGDENFTPPTWYDPRHGDCGHEHE